MNIIIYGLVDPRKPMELRYIGQTSDPERRLIQHVSNCRTRSSKEQWIAALRSQLVLPTMIALETCGEGIANEREAYWCERQPQGQLTNDSYSANRRAAFRDNKPKAVGKLAQAKAKLVAIQITESLTRHSWNVSRAAKELGISRPTLYDRIEALSLARP